MPEVAAIARLMATGGRATQMLANLKREARDAIEQLQKLERFAPAAARMGQSLEQLHEDVRSTGQLTTQQFERYQGIAQSLQYYAREAARYSKAPEGGRPLTAEEVERHRQYGRRTEAEIAGARVAPTGAIFFPRPDLPPRPVPAAVPRPASAVPEIVRPEAAAPATAAVAPAPEAEAAPPPVRRPQAEIVRPGPVAAAAAAAVGPAAEAPQPAAPSRPEAAADATVQRPQAEMVLASKPEVVRARPGAEPPEIQATMRRLATEREQAKVEAPRRLDSPVAPPAPEITPEERGRIQAMTPGERAAERRRLERNLFVAGMPLTQYSPGAQRAFLGQSPELAARYARLQVLQEEAPLTEEARHTTGELERQQEVQRRGMYQQRLSLMGDREIVREWQTQSQEGMRLTATIRNLERERDRAQPGTERAAEAESKLTEALQGRRVVFHQEQAALREARDRQLRVGAWGGRRPAVAAFLAGTGFGGGGGLGSAVVRAALGTVSPLNAASLIGGLLVGKGIQYGIQAYETYMRRIGETLPLARATGRPAERIVAEGAAEMRRYPGMFDVGDLYRAREMLGRATGRIAPYNLERGILPIATITGQTAEQEASRIIEMQRYTPRFTPALSLELYRAFAGSAFGGRRAMYPEFAGRAGELVRGMATPFTAPSAVGIGRELRAATRFRLPGITMRSRGGLRLAADYAVAEQTGVAGVGGPLGQMNLIAMMNLARTNPVVAEKLKGAGFDIDIATLPGMLRAIERAPELASRGVPEVLQAIYRTQRQYTTPDIYELLLRRAGTPGEVAHRLAAHPEDIEATTAAVRRRTGPTDRQIEAEAQAVAGTPAAQHWWEYAGRPEVMQLEGAPGMIDKVGDVLTKGMNDLRQALLDWLNAPTSVPGAVAQDPASRFSLLENYSLTPGG
jgi:hypothetical protein